MGRYKIIVSNRADKFLDRLNEELRHRVIEETSDLENFPFLTKPHDIAKLKGKKGYYRLRVGKIRTIFKVSKKQRTIYIEKIGYRKQIYK